MKQSLVYLKSLFFFPLCIFLFFLSFILSSYAARHYDNKKSIICTRHFHLEKSSSGISILIFFLNKEDSDKHTHTHSFTHVTPSASIQIKNVIEFIVLRF